MYNPLFLPEIREMLAENSVAELRECCTALHPARTAEFMEGLTAEETWRVLQHADEATRVEIFHYFELPKQIESLETQPQEEVAGLITKLASDDRVDLLNEVDHEIVERLLPLLPSEERRDILHLRSYPEGTAGAVMTTAFAKLAETLTIRQAFDELQHQAEGLETIYYVYIVDDGRHLMGFVSLRKLIQSRPTAKIESIIDRGVISVRVDDDQEHVANEVLKYAFLAIPVVDDQNRLVGIVTHDDAAEVLQEEATEDAHLAGAVQPLEDGYIATPFWELCWKRGMWLVILLGAASLTAQVMQFLEGGESASWMVLFLPMVLASGGNAGSQSATLVIRALALDETDGRVLWIAGREARVGAVLGAVLASLSWIVARGMAGTEPSYIVSLTVFCVVAMGTIFGAMLPLALNRLKFDPALMSNPLIAALSDILGVVIYYNISAAIVKLI
ncbi:MAG: magnesium transporter [Planctomycetales bacterium]|nr:magnesium transporter [Planctomycetales bacterium]